MSLHGNGWSEQKRVEVATAQAMGLKAPMIEVATGVPAQTIRHWRTMDWFKDLVAELQREDDSEADAKLTKIFNKSLDVIVDRLENGEFMYDKGKRTFVRRPAYLKDVSRVSDLVFDKRNLIRGKPTSISGKQEQISDRLSKLAIEFERFINAKVINKEVIDAIPESTTTEIHALPETRDSGPMGQGVSEPKEAPREST